MQRPPLLPEDAAAVADSLAAACSDDAGDISSGLDEVGGGEWAASLHNALRGVARRLLSGTRAAAPPGDELVCVAFRD